MSQLAKEIFNTGKTDYDSIDLFLGQATGLLDSIHKHHPEIFKNYKRMVSLQWDENEFDYSTCNQEFKTCSPGMYQAMIYNLAYQWEADTVASRSVAPILAPFITNSELWCATMAIGQNEILHCLAEGTEVAIQNDKQEIVFKPIEQITIADKVYQCRHDGTDKAVVNPTKVYSYDYNGPMHLLDHSSGYYKKLVTPEHRVPVFKYTDNELEYVFAKDIQATDLMMLPIVSDFKAGTAFVSSEGLTNTVVDYKGKVYCLEVPSGYFIIRYEGKTCVTGNSLTYSEIVRNSFDNPDEVFKEITEITEAFQRLEKIANVFAKTYNVSHRYALGQADKQEAYDALMMFYVALYCLERIQFIVSFIVTFAFGEIGMFVPIAKAVQKICQDEFEVHQRLDRLVINHELSTQRGQDWLNSNKDKVKDLITEVVESEIQWAEFLGSGDRELPGITVDKLKESTIYHAGPVYDAFGIVCPYPRPDKNPLPFTEEWMNINAIQAAPQEEAGRNSAYLIGRIMPRGKDKVYDAEDL